MPEERLVGRAAARMASVGACSGGYSDGGNDFGPPGYCGWNGMGDGGATPNPPCIGCGCIAAFRETLFGVGVIMVPSGATVPGATPDAVCIRPDGGRPPVCMVGGGGAFRAADPISPPPVGGVGYMAGGMGWEVWTAPSPPCGAGTRAG